MTKPIESVSAALGVVYQPTRMRRKVHADADAMLILASADVERQAILHRAGARLAFQEARRQENIEAVIDRAAIPSPKEVSTEPISAEWTARLFEAVQNVSDQMLREYWAGLLAREVTAPGTCSLRTLTILNDMSSANASMFKRVCNLALTSDARAMLPIPVDWFYFSMKWNVASSDVLVLESLGLVHLLDDIARPILASSKLRYGGGEFDVDLRGKERVELDVIPFTTFGDELFRVCGCEADLNYFEELEEKLAETHNLQLVQTGGAV